MIVNFGKLVKGIYESRDYQAKPIQIAHPNLAFREPDVIDFFLWNNLEVLAHAKKSRYLRQNLNHRPEIIGESTRQDDVLHNESGLVARETSGGN